MSYCRAYINDTASYTFFATFTNITIGPRCTAEYAPVVNNGVYPNFDLAVAFAGLWEMCLFDQKTLIYCLDALQFGTLLQSSAVLTL